MNFPFLVGGYGGADWDAVWSVYRFDPVHPEHPKNFKNPYIFPPGNHKVEILLGSTTYSLRILTDTPGNSEESFPHKSCMSAYKQQETPSCKP